MRILSSALLLAFTPVLFAQSAVMPPAKIVGTYCVGCHNQKLKTAGVALDKVDASNVSADAAVWEKVLRKVSTGEMPPAGLPRPKPLAKEAFTNWLCNELDSSATAHPNPGRSTIHRLNRAEYSNAIRDLLSLDIKPGAKLPADDTGYGFDNIGDVLSLSPILIERYMTVARQVSRLAVGDTSLKPDELLYQNPRGIGKRQARPERASEDLPFDSAGGVLLTYHFPTDAEYLIKIKLPAVGETVQASTIETRIPVKAGTRKVGVTFLAVNGIPETAGRNPTATVQPEPAKMDLRIDGARVKLFDVPAARFSTVSISGPYDTTGPGQSASRQKIFICKPASASEELPCARKILTNLALHGYRRPITATDVAPLLTFYQAGRKEAGFERGIEWALRALLVSPDFLFRLERDSAGVAPGSVQPLNEYELASRLSFFLWSSIPDDELLRLASAKKLSDPGDLRKQVSRMLDDPKSAAFVDNFAGQWLYLRTLSQVKPDPDAFPQFDNPLRQAFEKETELFFAAVLRENRPVTDLLTANFTYLNARLAEHYKIPGIYGSQFRRVELSDPKRGGLLGQGSILTVTSYPNRTSVVQRGKWVLENLLGAPPPPPPPDIPPLEAHAKDGKSLTMRQQMEMHRANPTCASCHARMDPIGFALENYDGVGAWRSKDAGSVIDATGKLPDGTTFEGPAGLRNLLATAHREEFVDTVTEKLMTYALGRGIEYYDRPAMRSIMREAAKDNTTISALIQAIVHSPQFRMRRTRES